jgi:hypothetical protein
VSLFRRRHEAIEDAVESVHDAEDGHEAAAAGPGTVAPEGEPLTKAQGGPVAFDRSEGPWDDAEAGETDAVEPGLPPYIDLGALRFRAREGLELNLEVDEAQSRVTSVTAKLGGSAVQLQAFAAPRSAGIWDEIREGIAQSVAGQGGSVDEVPGVFGRELLARVPVRGADGKPTRQAVRFTGVDGPRWFLRAVFHGEAAYRTESAVDLEELVRSVVVSRGAEAMAPRDLLALKMPSVPGAPTAADQSEEIEEPAEPGQQQRAPLRPFERGPEITEVR